MENLPPHTLRLLYKEVSTLTSDPPPGIKLFPNEEDVTDVQVTIEGPGEPIWGGVGGVSVPYRAPLTPLCVSLPL